MWASPPPRRRRCGSLFDNDRVYISFRCWDSAPSLRVAKEMRRDNGNIWNSDDNIAFLLDTFFDHRNGFQFTLNSIGGRQDAQVFNERQWVGDWNTVWDFKTGQFEGGWTAETAIPFKSLRYRPGSDQTWGFNVSAHQPLEERGCRSCSPFPTRSASAASCRRRWRPRWSVCPAPSGSRNLEIKPYGISNAKTDRGQRVGPHAPTAAWT